MNSKTIKLSIIVTVMAALSYSANAQNDSLNRISHPTQTQQQIDAQNKKDEQNKMIMNPNDKYQTDSTNSHATGMQHQMASDHIIMQNGKMMMMKEGKAMPMEKEIIMKNGTICMSNGKCKLKDGSTVMMKEGEMMDMNGKMMEPKKAMPK